MEWKGGAGGQAEHEKDIQMDMFVIFGSSGDKIALHFTFQGNGGAGVVKKPMLCQNT